MVERMGDVAASSAPQPPRRIAFVREQVDVDRSPLQTYRCLSGDHDWLLQVARVAMAEAHALHCPGPCHLELPALVLLDDGAKDRGNLLVPMRWQSDARFPVLDGNLELRAVKEGSCHLQLIGCYRQPIEAIGDGHPTGFAEMAEATAGMFLSFLAARC